MKSLEPRRLPALSAAALVLLALAGCADPEAAASGTGESAAPAENGIVYNLAPEQDRVRAEKVADLAAQVPADIAEDGKLTVGVSPFAVPLSVYATDDKTVIGNETDIAQLVADKLGLELDLQATSWENWPLKTQSGDFEAVFSNVGINGDRVQLFDFAPYRAAFMAFEAREDSDLAVNGSADISGKKVAVGSGTNQEKILLAWNKELEDAGKAPAELQYYGNDADTILALSSGRLDLNLSPYPSATYRENTRDDLKIVGKVNAGWPSETLVAATTLRDNGLAEPLAAAINSAIEDGSYGEVLERWGLADEAIPESTVVNAANFGK
ncbi:transporter substrate-binding domain-containing protein [Arthrobacter burdickii]|uniref:Transporter substrate-binding domain-containing protein n=1 Tax=Arthrobacter burdickii TaxID=3035920 RepID=A0ABT8JY22_9MICC|nr:transporter substrate-binding domain-containing protein [Arthrobacter burdickii]MDN4610060.1 transporter substrate-binding domain-containing protein [Arthrobacter burdickii]